jgi:tripartite-type tricarboxylate transporter receptor subunit TctC
MARSHRATVHVVWLSFAAINCAHAQTYPVRPIRMIVPFAVGGGTDIVARAVALKIGDAFGQSVVVDNKTGANGNIGMELAARPRPMATQSS